MYELNKPIPAAAEPRKTGLFKADDEDDNDEDDNDDDE